MEKLSLISETNTEGNAFSPKTGQLCQQKEQVYDFLIKLNKYL